MFENFAWDPSVLRSISRHWDTAKPLPDDVIAALVKSRYADAGITSFLCVCVNLGPNLRCVAGHQWRRIIAMSLVDMSLHTEAEKNRMNTAELYASSIKSLIWIPMTEGTNPVASWQHLTTGYNAGYYGT